MSNAISWAPLYIKPLGCKTTEEERRAGYEYAREHLAEIEIPQSGPWAYFTTDPTDKSARAYSIARPGTGGKSSRFGDNAYTAAMCSDHAAHLIKDADIAISMANYYAAHEQPTKSHEEHEKARRFRTLAQEYRAAAARIRAQWAR